MNANIIIEKLQAAGIKAEVIENRGRTSIVVGEGKIRPTIYFDNYEDEDELVDFVVMNYEKLMMNGEKYVDQVEDLLDYEKVKNLLSIRLRPTTYNVENVCCEKLYDLYMIAIIKFEDGVIEIKDDLCEKWNRSRLQVLMDAVENSKDSYEIISMAKVMSEMMGMEIDENDAALPMWVISTHDRVEGAGVMFHMSYFKELAEKLNSDLIILPSSIHEILVVSANEMNEEMADEMIKDVNETQVIPSERLSDHCYRFSRKSGMIEWEK